MSERTARLTHAELALVVLTIAVVGLLVHPYRAHQASRYALTAALVERGTVMLDDYEHVLGIDKAVIDGHIFSDKAPGQPIFAVPFFALGRLLWVEEATNLRIEGNLGLWWVTFVSAVLPGALLALLMYRRAIRIDERHALAAVVSILFGTLLFPFSSVLFGHVLAATLLFGSYLLLVGAASSGRLAAAGLLAGLAVTVEYTAFLGVLVLIALAVFKLRSKALTFVAGGVPAAVALAAYNWVAFGNPLTLSYQLSAFGEVAESPRSVTAQFSAASIDNTLNLLFAGRGLIVATPIVVTAVAGAVWRLRRGFQPDAAMALAMFAIFLLIPVFWGNPWGGESPGPRYMTPALPFLAVPLAWALSRWRLLSLAAIGLSILTMTAATVTDPLDLPRTSLDGLGHWLRGLANGDVVDTLPTMAFGSFGWILHIAALGAVLYLLVRSRREPSGNRHSLE